jgi:hypothetical protein
MRAFCLPGGEESARRVNVVRIAERGEFRSAPNARWGPFTSELEIDARRSRFRWDARFRGGARGFFGVTDAYENGAGRLTIRVGGVPVKKMTGLEFDKGELQRYISSFVMCPPMLINNPSLVWTAAGPSTLRVCDRDDPTGATVDVDVDGEGSPVLIRAERPRSVGSQAPLTPWFAVASEFREREGLRIPNRLVVSWGLPEGPFDYYRGEVVSFAIQD